jgi:hypothetical protein
MKRTKLGRSKLAAEAAGRSVCPSRFCGQSLSMVLIRKEISKHYSLIRASYKCSVGVPLLAHMTAAITPWMAPQESERASPGSQDATRYQG